MDLVRERGLLNSRGSEETVKEWKKVKVFEDLTQESSVTFEEPYTELLIISENLKGENGAQLIKYLNGQMMSGQNGDISSTITYNCIDFFECICGEYVKNTHIQRRNYPTLGLSGPTIGILGFPFSEITSLRISPQYKTFTSGKATIYAR